ncbi:MAG: flavodoxin family protein [Bacillota bacterium]
MTNDWTRRAFLGAAGAAVTTAAVTSAQGAEGDKSIKIVAVSCSPRKGKTTSAALQACLDAAKAVSPRIEVELIELGGLKIDGSIAAGIKPEPGQQDDFPQIQAKLSDPAVAGIIIGSPTYFGSMSSLCKAFLERWMAFRKDSVMRNKVAGCLAVGGARNGGQELVLQQIQAILFAQDMILVGDGKPNCHRGATLWNNSQDDISKDEWGMGTAKALGRRVAEVALMIAR